MVGTHKTYRGHRLVASSDPKKKGILHCTYCAEKVEEEVYWNGARDESAPIECKKNPGYKPPSSRTTQKIWG